jgi:hypothetical protein
MTKIKEILHEDQYIFLAICRSVPLIMRHVSDKLCREYQTTHFVFNNIFENCAFMR